MFCFRFPHNPFQQSLDLFVKAAVLFLIRRVFSLLMLIFLHLPANYLPALSRIPGTSYNLPGGVAIKFHYVPEILTRVALLLPFTLISPK